MKKKNGVVSTILFIKKKIFHSLLPTKHKNVRKWRIRA